MYLSFSEAKSWNPQTPPTSHWALQRGPAHKSVSRRRPSTMATWGKDFIWAWLGPPVTLRKPKAKTMVLLSQPKYLLNQSQAETCKKNSKKYQVLFKTAVYNSFFAMSLICFFKYFRTPLTFCWQRLFVSLHRLPRFFSFRRPRRVGPPSLPPSFGPSDERPQKNPSSADRARGASGDFLFFRRTTQVPLDLREVLHAKLLNHGAFGCFKKHFWAQLPHPA